MKHLPIYTSLLLGLPSITYADQNPDEKYARLAKKLKVPAHHIVQCQDKLATKTPSDEVISQCLIEARDLERIEVFGRYIGLEAPEVVGRFYLDRTFIENAPKNNGDINELIALLPGVQISEDAYSIDSLQEIKAQEISISGAQAWQTGFFIDGMNYNSRQDPASASRSAASANDVEGGVQTMNVNSQMVSAITVYDNNIPAEFGNFSGGVVDVETLSPFESAKQTTLKLGYRGTQSDWGSYHTIISEDSSDDNSETPQEFNQEPPVFEKNNYNLQLGHKFSQHHGVFVSFNYLDSIISDISLSQTKKQERRNINALFKYSYRDGWIDSLDWSLIYAPYENHNFLKDTLNSDFKISGGATGTSVKLKHDFSSVYLSSEFNLSQSDNSREAPPHYYIWLQAKGKDWGRYADGNNSETPVSLEGGHGDLDKVQTTAAWKSKLVFNHFDLLGAEHSVYLGTDIEFERIQRDRDSDSYFYNAPLQYSTGFLTDGLNCSGYTLDCVELSFIKPLDELIVDLGGSFDLTNTDHLLAYSNNIATTPQYFQSRLVRPEEHISAELMRYAFFASDNIEFGRINATLSARVEYDDFFENLNISPRFSMGYDLFGDGNSKLIFGVNRYYDAGLLTYKIREQERPSYTQYRPIRDGYLQGWVNSASVADYKYRYSDIKTPYDDELVLGFKHATSSLGTFSLKFVKRKKHDQLARESQAVIEDDGFSYIQVNNAGYGESERFTFAWDLQLGRHSLWLNSSHTDNYSNVEDYDTAPDQVPLEDLVSYENRLMSKADLTLINTNFARPIRANLGWATDWSDSFTTSFTGSYSQGYETAVATGGYTDVGDVIEICQECEVSSNLVPTYVKSEVKSRFLVNMGLNWQPQIYGQHSLKISVDVSNLFDARTYAVKPNTSGIETGRQLWLGIDYGFN